MIEGYSKMRACIVTGDSHILTAATTTGMNIFQNPSNQNPEK